MSEKVDDFIAHYASEFYNPTKAHEYYLKTRKLKSKAASTALTSPDQKTAFAVAKDSINTAKTADLTKAGTEAQAALDLATANAKATADRIQGKLTDFLQQVMSDTPIPATASPKLRAFLEAQRSTRAKGATDEANAQMQKVGRELKEVIASARAAYAANKQAIKDKYDKAADTEQQNIKKNIKGAAPKTTTKAKAKAKSSPKAKSTSKTSGSKTLSKSSQPTARKKISIIRNRAAFSSAEGKKRMSNYLSKRN